MKNLMVVLFILTGTQAHAMQSRVMKVQNKAYFTSSNDGLYQVLDLKKRQVVFQAQDFDQCGKVMLRTKGTLQFECKLTLPTSSAYNKLRTQISALTLSVRFGGSEKAVAVQLNPAASEVSFSTKFDATGIDFEMTGFNDEMLRVYSKVAQLVFAQAMQENPLVYEVYETPEFNRAETAPAVRSTVPAVAPKQIINRTKHRGAKKALKRFVGI